MDQMSDDAPDREASQLQAEADACALCDGGCGHEVSADDLARLERRGLIVRIEPKTPEEIEAARRQWGEDQAAGLESMVQAILETSLPCLSVGAEAKAKKFLTRHSR
jgi:hypothetical protein